MAWQLTTALARIGRAIGVRREWSSPAAYVQAQALLDRRTGGDDDAIERAYARLAAALPEEARFALTKAKVDLDAAGHRATRAVLASGAPASVAVAFAHAWPTLSASARSLAADPLGRDSPGPVTWRGPGGPTPARQVDATTCGAASLAMMAMIGDPTVGLWLANGAALEGYLPPEIARIPGPERATAEDAGVAERWAALQRSVHADATRFGLGPFPWPRMFGTPPWRADNAARFLGVRFDGAVADDTDDPATAALIAHAAAALADGIPVPMYASGDSGRGLDTAIPRHVVLLTHRTADGFLAYEPGSAALHPISDRQVLDGGESLKALGNWSHVSWFVLPRARPRA